MSIRHVALALAALVVGACDLPNDPNLNNPSVTDFSTIADLPHLQALVTGVLRGDRVQNENEIIYGETLGRDAMRLTGSEPRFVTELLGPSSIDPSDFLGGALWPYAVVRLANIGLHGVSGAPATLLDAQGKPATLGFVQTIKALVVLRVIEMHDTTGAPVDVDIDPPVHWRRCAARTTCSRTSRPCSTLRRRISRREAPRSPSRCRTASPDSIRPPASARSIAGWRPRSMCIWRSGAMPRSERS